MTYASRLAPLAPLVLLAACAGIDGPMGTGISANGSAGAEAEATAPPPEEIAAIVQAPKPAAGARTADQFDTTTDEQKAAASAPSTGGSKLGEVTASLGDATEPGLWVKTSLVDTVTAGRVEYPANGKTAKVELRPRDGGTQISLAAFRLLGIDLTDIPTVVIYAE